MNFLRLCAHSFYPSIWYLCFEILYLHLTNYTYFFCKKPVYKKLEAEVQKLSVLNFLVSEKLRNLFLKQNIFPLDFYTRCPYKMPLLLSKCHLDDMNGIEMILLEK